MMTSSIMSIMSLIMSINMFKINLVTARKKIFKIFFQLLKLKITYELNIYRLIC